jgi:transposase
LVRYLPGAYRPQRHIRPGGDR